MLQQRKGKNYLDNFSGFIEEILLRSTEPLTTEHIVQKMDHNFSFSIPNGTVKILVKRGEKSQRILCISQHEPKKYTLNNAVINSDTTRDFESTRNEVNRKIDDVGFGSPMLPAFDSIRNLLSVIDCNISRVQSVEPSLTAISSKSLKVWVTILLIASATYFSALKADRTTLTAGQCSLFSGMIDTLEPRHYTTDLLNT